MLKLLNTCVAAEIGAKSKSKRKSFSFNNIKDGKASTIKSVSNILSATGKQLSQTIASQAKWVLLPSAWYFIINLALFLCADQR